MALDPQSKDSLMKFTMAAKKVIYNPKRMEHFMGMLGSPTGAVMAVQTVLAVINKGRPIPPQVVPLLAVNCYLVMVDVAQAATQVKPSAQVMKAVIANIMDKVKQVNGANGLVSNQRAEQPQQAPSQAQPQGIIASRQGVPA